MDSKVVEVMEAETEAKVGVKVVAMVQKWVAI